MLSVEEINKLKAENERMKSIIEFWQKMYADAEAENAELKAENDRLKEKNEKLNKMTGIFSARLCEKYCTTLQEIKEIAENREIFCENCSFCCDEFTCDDCGYVKILQKITKAEEE